MTNEVIHIIDAINVIIERSILIVILITVLQMRGDMRKGGAV
jgi:hypothetical protein